MLQSSNSHYEMDGRYQGIAHGGIGVIHLLSRKIGLIDEIMKSSMCSNVICPTMSQITSLILLTM